MAIEKSSGNTSEQKIEKAKLTHREQVIQEIGEYLKDMELSSVRFQAFADYTDYVHADEVWRRNTRDRISQIEYCLIGETVRQRTNGITGYKKEYEYSQQLGKKLAEAIHIDRQNGKDESDYSIYLGYMKNSVINKANRGSRIKWEIL